MLAVTARKGEGGRLRPLKQLSASAASCTCGYGGRDRVACPGPRMSTRIGLRSEQVAISDVGISPPYGVMHGMRIYKNARSIFIILVDRRFIVL